MSGPHTHPGAAQQEEQQEAVDPHGGGRYARALEIIVCIIESFATSGAFQGRFDPTEGYKGKIAVGVWTL